MWAVGRRRATLAVVIAVGVVGTACGGTGEPVTAAPDRSTVGSQSTNESARERSTDKADENFDDKPGSTGAPKDRPEADSKPKSESKPESDPKPKPKPAKEFEPEPRPRTYLVTRVIDGDTVELGNGEAVRIVGIDTPEVGDCGYDQATAKMVRLVQGKQVTLVRSDENADYYGRLLRYVDRGDLDAGLRQIKSGWAIARYDSRDGYGFHARENRYIAADKASPDKARTATCADPAPAPQPQPQPQSAPAPAGNCASGYKPCIPPYPPDVDCGDVNGPIYISGSDPHGLDADGDGVACE